jgi:hypothetical protein
MPSGAPSPGTPKLARAQPIHDAPGSPFDAPTRVADGNPFDAATRVAEPPSDFLRSPTSEPAVIATPIEPTGEGVRIGDDAAGGEPKVIVPAAADSGENPFDDRVWRAEGGSDAEADLAGAHPIIGGNPLRDSLSAFFASKRNVAIAAGAAVLLIVVIAMASGGGGDKPSSKQATTAKRPTATKVEAVERAPTAPAASPEPANAVAEAPTAAAPADEPTPDEPAAAETARANTTGTEGAGTGGVADSATAGDDKPATDDKPAPDPKPAADKPAVKKAPTLGGKQVVLEYDTQAREGKPVPNAARDEQAAIGKARSAYTAGNSKLFAGDPDSAIQYYRQALAAYPAYVASYRGLGLAYAQKGDNASAVKALRTYVGAAPHAKDASLIRKRIQSLSAK